MWRYAPVLAAAAGAIHLARTVLASAAAVGLAQSTGIDQCVESELSELSDATSFVQHTAVQHAGASSALDGVFRQLSLPELAGCRGVECLDRYVQLDDPAFEWRDTGRRLSGTDGDVAWTGYMLTFTSQRWGGAAWTHALVLVVPEGRDLELQRQGWCSLYAAFGLFGGPLGAPPISALTSTNEDVQATAAIAVRTGTPAAVFFADPPRLQWGPRTLIEDALMAETVEAFRQEPKHPELLVSLPMIKAAVRAMDVVSAFARSSQSPPGGFNASVFAVTGASKRGGVAWGAMAVDPRVHAIAPLVWNVRIRKCTQLAVRSLGGVPFAMYNYVAHHFLESYSSLMASPAALAAGNITDVSEYFHRLEGKGPKLIVAATGDEFLMPDHSRVYYSDVPGPKAFLMVPNQRHIAGDAAFLRVAPKIGAFFRAAMLGQPPPALAWTIGADANGTIAASLAAGAPAPLRVELWQATTCDGRRRDFRYQNMDGGVACLRCGVPENASGLCNNLRVGWRATPLPEAVGEGDAGGGRTWRVGLPPPGGGRWRAFFVRFELPGPRPPGPGETSLAGETTVLSTEVSVVPQTFPFPDCLGNSCGRVTLAL